MSILVNNLYSYFVFMVFKIFSSRWFKMKREKAKDEEAGGANPYANLDKTTVLQEVLVAF